MGLLEMNIELLMGNSTRCTAKKDDKTCMRNTHPQNSNLILPTYDEEISPESIFLLSKFHIDIQFIYPFSYPSTFTLSLWQFPPSLLISFSFFLFQYLSSFHSPFKLFRSLFGD